jgi:hypothetical protein
MDMMVGWMSKLYNEIDDLMDECLYTRIYEHMDDLMDV